MFASVLALVIGVFLTFGVLAFYVQYSLPENVMLIWFIAMIILAAWQIADFLTPYITKILP